MLATLGIIAGKDNLSRFLYFLFSFAVWDIIYYIALKILLLASHPAYVGYSVSDTCALDKPRFGSGYLFGCDDIHGNHFYVLQRSDQGI